MLADSVLSELYRLSRNRMAVFWSALFVPIGFAIGGIAFNVITRSKIAEMTADMAPGAASLIAVTNLGQDLVQCAGIAANGAILVFMLIGAATLYAGDYRWETWRLISARNSRLNLILGKVGAFKVLTLAAMVLFLIGGMIFSISGALINGHDITFSIDGGDAGDFGLLLLLGYIRIVQYAMIALLAGVFTRSLLAALFVPVVLGFAQSLLGGPGLAILQWDPTSWQSMLLLPGLAFEGLKAMITAGVGAPSAPEGLMLKAIVSLALWTLVPLAGAIAWFNRQDLSKE
ncbi:hypothetical protein [Brevundimonas sp.]|uniref:hypothetical protein n=1 Tax=Brevundimonas sp. TaxID=1871086 RepID=UPI003D0DD7EA